LLPSFWKQLREHLPVVFDDIAPELHPDLARCNLAAAFGVGLCDRDIAQDDGGLGWEIAQRLGRVRGRDAGATCYQDALPQQITRGAFQSFLQTLHTFLAIAQR
jgi:hypothetical protein